MPRVTIEQSLPQLGVRAETSQPVSLTTSVTNLARSAYSLFVTPGHQLYHKELELSLASDPIPLQPDLDQTEQGIKEVLEDKEIRRGKSGELSKKLMQTAYLIQFIDHFTIDPNQTDLVTDLTDITSLKDDFLNRSAELDRPLTFAEQLELSLELKEGNLSDSLTLLWLASRQYARWYDTSIIPGSSELTKEEVLHEMMQWRSTLLACKPWQQDRVQDPSGDTYYAWTHALAQVIFGVDSSPGDVVARAIFRQGTNIMRSTIHALGRQDLRSDHRTAATYGNLMGKLFLTD